MRIFPVTLLCALLPAVLPLEARASSIDSLHAGLVAPARFNTAQSDSGFLPSGRLPRLRWYDMVWNVPGDWVRWGHVTFRESNIEPYLGVSAATALLIWADEPAWQASKRWYNSSPPVKSASDILTDMGDGSAQFALAGAFGAYGLLSGDHHALRTGSEIVEVVLASGAVVQVLKHITGRESPFVETAPAGKWRFFPNQIQYHKHVPHFDAFPSGHLTTSMGTVVVLAEDYPDEKWIGPLGYTLVGLIGVSMVNTGIHWYSDYPLALALGYAFGKLVAHPEGTPWESNEKSILSWAPVPLPRGFGIDVTLALH